MLILNYFFLFCAGPDPEPHSNFCHGSTKKKAGSDQLCDSAYQDNKSQDYKVVNFPRQQVSQLPKVTKCKQHTRAVPHHDHDLSLQRSWTPCVITQNGVEEIKKLKVNTLKLGEKALDNQHTQQIPRRLF